MVYDLFFPQITADFFRRFLQILFALISGVFYLRTSARNVFPADNR